MPHITRHASHVTHLTSHVTSHMSLVTRHTSRDTSPISLSVFHRLLSLKMLQCSPHLLLPQPVCSATGDVLRHITRHMSLITNHLPRFTRPRHTSQVARHTSHVTRHTSHVTRHTSHVTRHTLHFAAREHLLSAVGRGGLCPEGRTA
jgi:hypothetical protein